MRRALVIVLGLLAIGTVGCQTAPSHALPPLGTLSVTSEPARPQAVHVGDPITINYTVYNDGYDVDDVGLYLSGAEWDKYKSLPSHLPPELRERHAALYNMAVERAREKGWDPELGDDD